MHTIKTLPEFDQFKSKFLGPQGALTAISKEIRKLPPQERPQVGKWVNQTKTRIETLLTQTHEYIRESLLQEALGKPIDPTLPSPDQATGFKHPLNQVKERLTISLRKMGFSIAEGPEIETEWFCFDALNTPESHPSRSSLDTLYFKEDAQFANHQKAFPKERYLLRTHTSSIQIRTLLKEQAPLKISVLGRAFRRDTIDATHSSNFHQLEALYVDQEVTIKDLKAALDFFIQDLFGSKVITRLRPSFFPFTEPSFELDFKSPNLGKLSNRWIEIGGCGMVDPDVLKACNLDPHTWSGFAWGMGIERIAMLLHSIDDIRYFYQNDIRFLKQFA